MGHRKYSAPRRGSIAFRPRARAKSLEPRVRTWPSDPEQKAALLAFAGFKVGAVQVLTTDDREKTPNFGKHILNAATVIATPPIRIMGIRGYKEDNYGKHAIFDVYTKDSIKELSNKVSLKYRQESFSEAESMLDNTTLIRAIAAVMPHKIHISQKRPFIFELPVSGKDPTECYRYVKSLLDKELRITDVFRVGQNLDVSGITRGKGVEGPVTRFGIKRKQHKSRKSVRAVGTLGPISPAVVMYTVARQGQRGFHQRTEYNKRILIMSSVKRAKLDQAINPPGGFKHFGLVDGDYIVVRGSIPGVPKRLIKMRLPIRNIQKKIVEPKILEVITKK